MRLPEFFIAISAVTILSLVGCKTERKTTNEVSANDSLFINVQADIESDPVPGNISDDAADDPAIWYNESSPSESLVFGTDKKGGIIVYNLNGKILKYHKIGLPNNIDIRQGFNLGFEIIDVAGFSNRQENTIEVFKIMPDGDIINLLENKLKPKFSGEVYGFCFYRDNKKDKLYAIINSKDGDIEQWVLNGTTGKIIPGFVQSFKTKTQPEGMVADDEMEVLFVGEEDNGIWKFDLSNDGKQNPILIESSSIVLNNSLKDDIEGLTIYYSVNGGYLIASSQGNNSYAVFNRYGKHDYIGSFRITEGSFDGTNDTDGIDIFNLPLNNTFPSGIFIAQDGANSTGSLDTLPQNFKFVNWSGIANSFSPALIIDTMYINGTKN